MRKRISVLSENETERNERFRDNTSGIEMTRNQFVREIEKGKGGKKHAKKGKKRIYRGV